MENKNIKCKETKRKQVELKIKHNIRLYIDYSMLPSNAYHLKLSSIPSSEIHII